MHARHARATASHFRWIDCLCTQMLRARLSYIEACARVRLMFDVDQTRAIVGASARAFRWAIKVPNANMCVRVRVCLRGRSSKQSDGRR